MHTLEQNVQNINRTICSYYTYLGDKMQQFKRIRDLREDADLTQKQVGEAINVPQRTYAYYESGQRMVPPQVLIRLADFYSVSVDYILGRTDSKNW